MSLPPSQLAADFKTILECADSLYKFSARNADNMARGENIANPKWSEAVRKCKISAIVARDYIIEANHEAAKTRKRKLRSGEEVSLPMLRRTSNASLSVEVPDEFSSKAVVNVDVPDSEVSPTLDVLDVWSASEPEVASSNAVVSGDVPEVSRSLNQVASFVFSFESQDSFPEEPETQQML